MKIAIIGNSGHGASAVSELTPDVNAEVIGYCFGFPEEDLEGLESTFQKKALFPPKFRSPEEMLDAVHPDILVVDSMFCKHAQWAEWGLNHGIHVYCEKPLATELSQLESLSRTVKNSTASLWGILPTRYMPWFYTAKQLIDQGTIGEIRMFQGQKSYKLGKRPDFFRHRELFGGLTPWVSIHLIDLILWMSECTCQRVSSFQSCKENFGYGDLEMISTTTLELENEVLAHVSADYYRPAGAPSHGDDRLRVVGTKGILEVRDQELSLINQNGLQKIPLIKPERDIFLDFLYHLERPELSSPFHCDGLLSSYVCLKARDAADKRKTLSLF